MQDRFCSRRNFLGMVASPPLLWSLESIAALTEEVEWLNEVQRPSAPLPADLDKLPLYPVVMLSLQGFYYQLEIILYLGLV